MYLALPLHKQGATNYLLPTVKQIRHSRSIGSAWRGRAVSIKSKYNYNHGLIAFSLICN